MVIGIGNVALDICRVLSKTRSEMIGSDISSPALNIIQNMPIEEIHMFGRRGPIEAGFTPKELGEMRNLERCSAIVYSRLFEAVKKCKLKFVRQQHLSFLFRNQKQLFAFN